MTFRIILTSTLLSLFYVRAQESFSVSGKVRDENNMPVAVGDVLLLQSGTEKLVKYTTLFEGSFKFEGIPKGTYALKISALGFEPYMEQIAIDAVRILAIDLKTNTTNLSEVEIVGAKNPITYKDGNIKVNVQNTYFASVPNPVDLLSRLPNILVSSDRENISILGKGTPLLYLGNQRISMEEFSALPIDGIETIEILNNPSAKYEAEGRAVILVRLKKNVELGFQGSIQETVSQKRNFNNYLALNANYSSKRWTLRANFGYNQLQQWESNSFLFEIPQRNIEVDYSVLIPKNIRVQLNPSFGIYHQWNDTDYISLNASARFQTDDAPFFTDTSILESGEGEFIQSETENDNKKDYYSASFNFNKKLSERWNVFTGIQYSGFRQVLDTEISNSRDNSGFILDQTREQEYSINSLAFRFDIEKTFSKNLKWEWGANISLANADAFSLIRELEPDIRSQIDFDYREDLYAVYSSFAGELGKSINFEMGARVERNEVDSVSDSDDIPLISRTNTNLFPKVNMSMRLDSVRTLNFNYSRNISRPDFSRASSITNFINPFLEASGNVNLRPTFTDELSANFQRGKISFFATFYQSSNPTNFTISYEEGADTAVLSLVNLEKELGFYTGITLPYTRGIWTSNSTITLNYNELKDDTATISEARPFLYAYTNHQLKIAKDTTLVFGAWTLGKRQEGIFQRKGMMAIEASISKTFFENWDCTLRFNDISRGTNFEESYAIDGVLAEGIYLSDLREVAFSIKYRFGSTKGTTFKNRDVDSNIERIN